jgi:hypothetical protein
MEMEPRVFNRGRFGKSYWACPVGSANRMGVENWLIFSLLDLLNYLNQLRDNAEKNAQDNMQKIEFINKNNFRKLNR